MTVATTDGGESRLCDCTDPTPGGGEHDDECRDCGKLIGRAIIGGEVHEGYTSLGNGQAFFDAKERWSLNSGNGGITSWGGDEWYFRTFGDAHVVVPHESRKARMLGVEALSFDHVVHEDGSVELIVLNRRVEDLPDGPKWPGEND